MQGFIHHGPIAVAVLVVAGYSAWLVILNCRALRRHRPAAPATGRPAAVWRVRRGGPRHAGRARPSRRADRSMAGRPSSPVAPPGGGLD